MNMQTRVTTAALADAPRAAAPLEPRCLHRLAPPSRWLWLPARRRGLLQKHPWCRCCGEVKAVGSERALDPGTLMNEVGRLERRLADAGVRLTEAQRRLVLRRLREAGAEDAFGLTREDQLGMVARAVAACAGVPAPIVRSYLAGAASAGGSR